jgi:hypothetical protein
MLSIRALPYLSLAGCLLLPVLLALGACNSGPSLPPSSAPQSAAPADQRLVTDIPMPPNAHQDLERSLVLGRLDHWTGRLVFKLGLSPAEAFSFYQRQMPGFGWDYVTAVQSEISVQTFKRGERVATIQIEGRTLGGSLVSIVMAPSIAPSVGGASRTAPVETVPLQ